MWLELEAEKLLGGTAMKHYLAVALGIVAALLGASQALAQPT